MATINNVKRIDNINTTQSIYLISVYPIYRIRKRGRKMIGTEIKKQREKKGFSLKKLSELSGVSDSIISDIEIGKVKNPGIMTVLKIAKGLEVDIAELTNVIEV